MEGGFGMSQITVFDMAGNKVGDTEQTGGVGAIKVPLTTGNKDVKVVFTP